MASKAWQALERRIAARFGTVRTPLSGSSSRHTASDTLHKELFIEAKWSGVVDAKGNKQITIKQEWLNGMMKDAQKEGKIPMLAFAFKADSQGRIWTILPIEVMEKLYEIIDDDGESGELFSTLRVSSER